MKRLILFLVIFAYVAQCTSTEKPKTNLRTYAEVPSPLVLLDCAITKFSCSVFKLGCPKNNSSGSSSSSNSGSSSKNSKGSKDSKNDWDYNYYYY